MERNVTKPERTEPCAKSACDGKLWRTIPSEHYQRAGSLYVKMACDKCGQIVWWPRVGAASEKDRAKGD